MMNKSLIISSAPLLAITETRAPYGRLVALDAEGYVFGIDLTTDTITSLCRIWPLPTLPTSDQHYNTPTPAIHASADGSFLACVMEYGTHGTVYDTYSGRCIQTLNGGDYYYSTVPFSACFIQHQGKPLLIHRSDWNRLDITDPTTGKILTERGPTAYVDEQRPEHYLDFFHGRLIPSPDYTWLYNDGWVWHPMGIPSVFNLPTWLAHNVWEAEDGPTRRRLAQLDTMETPACWIDNNTLALWGLCDDPYGFDAPVRDGITLHTMGADPSADKPNFEGPSGRLFSDGTSLFSCTKEELAQWSLATGKKISVHEGRNPQLFLRAENVFVEYTNTSLHYFRI